MIVVLHITSERPLLLQCNQHMYLNWDKKRNHLYYIWYAYISKNGAYIPYIISGYLNWLRIATAMASQKWNI